MKNKGLTKKRFLIRFLLAAIIVCHTGMSSLAGEIKPEAKQAEIESAGIESAEIESAGIRNAGIESAGIGNAESGYAAEENKKSVDEKNEEKKNGKIVGTTAGKIAKTIAGESDGNSAGGSDGNSAGGSDDDKESGRELSAQGYEIYEKDGDNLLNSLRKGHSAKIVVSVRADGIKTGEVSKSGIEVSKLSDSFSNGGKPKIKVTSGKEEELEFDVTFSKLTYRGKGDELKFRIRYKKTGIPSDKVTVGIAECEETSGSGGDDGEDVTGQPVVQIKRGSPQSPVGPGEAFTLVLEVENTSRDSDIEDLVISVNPGVSLFVTEDTNSRLIRQLNTKKKTQIQMNMAAGQELSGPSQTLELELKYNYYSGGRLTSASSSQKVLIPIKGGTGSGQPVIQVSRSAIGGPIRAGQAFEVGLRLENTGGNREIRNLTAIFEPNDQIALIGQTDTQNLGTLAPGQAVDFAVKLQAGLELSGAASQLIGLNLKFDYDSDKGTVQGTYGEKIVIPVNGEQAKSGAPTPNVIIQSYTYGGMVAAGQIFDLELELLNTSGQQAVENLVISLETGEGISINSSSNTLYIPRLEANETKKETVTVQALFQSKLQSPKITISSKYEYIDKRERKQSMSSETIAIPVYQPDRFELKEPVISENMRENEEGTISIPYVNKGRGQIFNVEARLEGDMRALEKELTLGNFESGKSGTLDFVVTPQKAGDIDLRVQVSYEDETMQKKTLTVPLTASVQKARDADEGLAQDSMTETAAKVPWKKPLAIFIGAALAGICAALFLKRKKPAAGEETGREDSWDDENDGFYEEIEERES